MLTPMGRWSWLLMPFHRTFGAYGSAVFFSIVAVALLVIGVFFFRQTAQAHAGKDAQVIAQLKKAGSNLKKPHAIDFYLYFPTREAAERVATKVRALRCEIKRVDPAASGASWLVLAAKSIVPAEAELVSLRNQFEALAKAENGEYDGWETQVVR